MERGVGDILPPFTILGTWCVSIERYSPLLVTVIYSGVTALLQLVQPGDFRKLKLPLLLRSKQEKSKIEDFECYHMKTERWKITGNL